MPHPAINTQTNLVQQQKFLQNGVQVQYSSQIWKSGKTIRPASKSNPLVHGYRAPSSWSATECRWTVSESQADFRNGSGTIVRRITGPWANLSANESETLAVLNSALAQDVLRKTLSRLTENDVAFNAFLLQGKQTLKTVTNLATGIASTTDSLMTSEFKHPRNWKRWLANAGNVAVENFSGKYLEYLYGWRPLADDVTNAFQMMRDGYTGPEEKRFRLVARGHRKLKDEKTFNRVCGTYWFPNWTTTQQLSVTDRCKLVLMYQFPNQAGEMLPTMTPFGTAWELAPWSFVVDWFIPVGDWIGAMEATQFAIYLQNAVLTQSSEVASNGSQPSRWVSTPVTGGFIETYRSKPPTVSGKTFTMRREILTPAQVLDRIRFPSFSSKFGLPQASQALALLSQVFNKWF